MNREKKDKATGWAVSIGIHAALLLFFLLVLAWKEPYPPHPEYGIELNFGLEQTGQGDVQPQNNRTVTTAEQVEARIEDVVEDQPLPREQTQPMNVEEVHEPTPRPSELESPVQAKPEQEKPQPKPAEEKKPAETSKASPVESARDEPKPAEAPAVDTKALYPSTGSQGTGQQPGDAGVPEGSVDARSLYGRQGGGGGGPELDLVGWIWDREPRPDDRSRENGRIVFEIRVNNYGEVIGLRTLDRTVSPGVEQVYRGEVEKLRFRPTSQNARPAPVTTGKITFIIRSN